MKSYANPFLFSLAFTLALAAGHGTGGQTNSSCGDVEQALKDSEQIKAGVVRGEVEKYFVQDGGLQFPRSTRYVFSKCPYLHMDVEFEPKAVPGQLFSADDVVVKTSKLYVDYSAKD